MFILVMGNIALPTTLPKRLPKTGIFIMSYDVL